MEGENDVGGGKAGKFEMDHYDDGVEKIEYQGFQLSRYAAELAEREGIDVGLIKRQLDLSPRERIEQSLAAADFVRLLREAGKSLRNEK